MKTRIKNLLPLLLLLALPAVVQAQNAYSTNADGSIYTYSTNADGSANIVAYAGPPWVFNIPTNINGLTVTTIGEAAFQDTSLTSVTIPKSVTSIGAYAFVYCIRLTAITVDTNNPAYSSLNGVLFDKSQTTLIQYPGGLGGSYTISNSVTSIGEEAFADDTSLTSVTIPNSVISIADDAFTQCSSLTTVTIPNGVTSIGDGVFDGCTSLISVTIPASVTSIGDYAFFDCASLKSVSIPKSVTNIGGRAFYSCSSLTSVTIGNNVTSIGEEAFASCTILTSMSIPSGVTSIGRQAFEFSGLTSVTIGNSVTSIGSYAFAGCNSLKGVYFQGNSPTPTNDATVFLQEPATVYYLPGTTGWGAMFDGLPTAPWFLPNPQILNHGPGFGVQPGGFGFTISWATNVSVVVEATTNLANPVWVPMSTSPLTNGTNYFSDPQWTNYPERFYRAASAFTVGGTLTGLPAGDTVTLQDNGSDNLTLSNNGTFTFPTALPDGYAYSVTVSRTSGGTLTTETTGAVTANGNGTISGANVTNVAVQSPLLYTGNLGLDMYNAALADGTAHGGVPAVMVTQYGGPFRLTAIGPYSYDIALIYQGSCQLAITVGNTSCSSTTFPSNTLVIQFGIGVACGQTFDYGY